MSRRIVHWRNVAAVVAAAIIVSGAMSIIYWQAAKADEIEDKALILGMINFVQANCKEWVKDRPEAVEFMAAWKTADIPKGERAKIARRAIATMVELENLGDDALLETCRLVGLKQTTLFDLVTP